LSESIGINLVMYVVCDLWSVSSMELQLLRCSGWLLFESEFHADYITNIYLIYRDFIAAQFAAERLSILTLNSLFTEHFCLKDLGCFFK
jgi:hypothetical protein